MALSTAPLPRPKVLTVGIAGIDFTATLPSYPIPDAKVRSTSLLIDGGGNAANTACAMGRLGLVDVVMATAVGNDSNGDAILTGIRREGVVASEGETVERYEGASPFTYVMVTDVDGKSTRTCVHQPGSGILSSHFAGRIDLGACAAVHFDGRFPAGAVELARRCVEGGIPYSVDAERPREGLDELLDGVSVVVANSKFCHLALGEDVNGDSEKEEEEVVVGRLRRAMQEKAPRAAVAVTTLGGRGSCLVVLRGEAGQEEGCVLHLLGDKEDKGTVIPSVVQRHGALWCEAWGGVEVVDTTGAGDAFQGGFLSALWLYRAAKGESGNKLNEEGIPTDTRVLAHALRIGTRVASQKLRAPGARRGLPRGGEDKFVQSEVASMLKC